MTTLIWILVATIGGGVLSAACASMLAFRSRPAQVPVLISYSVGALLGAVFLELVPHAFNRSDNLQATAATILAGILLFFVLEKFVLWRHCHVEQCEAHDPPDGHVHDAASHHLAWLGGVFGAPVVPVGVDEFGQSGSIPELYGVFDLLPDQLVNAALVALAGA